MIGGCLCNENLLEKRKKTIEQRMNKLKEMEAFLGLLRAMKF